MEICGLTNSPAIDTGINAYVTDVSSDLDGEQRKVDGDLNGTKIVDMGAYEFKVEEIFVPLVYR